jgi:hypothetical protein
MSFTAGDCQIGIQSLLMNRSVADSIRLEATRKAVLELTEDYKHPLLEATGPTVQFTAYTNSYSPNFFLNSGDADLDVSKVNSFFMYTNPFSPPSSINTETNSGYDLKFRSFDSIEVLLNIAGLPMYWSRNNNQLLIASMPDDSYYTYMRYQKQHPNSDTVNGFTDDTEIMMADSWQEILEYATALRIAPFVNLSNKKDELHTSLYGDQKFQTSSGIEGAPGLIFQRTSQRNRDQVTTQRRLRLRMGGV